MKIGSRHLAATTADWLKAVLAADDSTRSSLPGLASSLCLTLPASRPHALNTSIVERDYPDTSIICALGDLGEVTMEPVGEARGQAPCMLDDGDLASRGRDALFRRPGEPLDHLVSPQPP